MNENIEPQRLLDDPGVVGSLRGDLIAASAAPALQYDVEVGLARFQAELASVSAAGTGAAVGTSVTQAGGALAVGKVVVGVAGLLVVGGVVWALLSGGPTPTAATAVAAAPEPAEPVAEPAASAATGLAQALPSGPTPTPEPNPGPDAAANPNPNPNPNPNLNPNLNPDPEARPSSAPAPAERPAAQQKRPESAQASDFLLEAKKVQQAKKALDSDPARTLRLLREIDGDVPKGQLMEERQGLRVLALIGTGETGDGKQRANAYLARYPQGTLATRVRRALEQLP